MEEIKKVIKILNEAEKTLGLPYEYGAKITKQPKSFDCSSLIMYLFKKSGIDMPRSSILQATKGEEIKKDFSTLDLLFFRSDRGHYYDELFKKKVYIGHVAIFLDDNLILHAKSQKGVILQKLSELQKDPNYKITIAKRVIKIKDTPLYKTKPLSQFLDIKNKKWKNKSCGVVALTMLINQKLNKNLNPNKILQGILKKDAYLKNIGWKHKELTEHGKEFGVNIQSYDLAQNKDEYAILKLFEALKKGAVIASVHKEFNPKNNGHLIILVGLKNNKIYFYDPEKKERNEILQKVNIYRFQKGWKKRFIA